MKRKHYIGMDAHCEISELKVVTASGRLVYSWRGPTTIPALTEAIEKIPRPRYLAIEEGPIADWLFRNLSHLTDDFVVSDPRRNHLIAKEGDKDDPIDAEKLAHLLRGGYLKHVHHSESLDRAVFKRHVTLYHRCVGQRTGQACRIMGNLRFYGVFVEEKAFAKSKLRNELLSRLPRHRLIRPDLKYLWKIYDTTAEQEDRIRRLLISEARKEEQICRFQALPGIGWIHGSTFFAYIDTPWRFKSKSALWKYMGIGLERRHSGKGPMRLHVDLHANRILKTMIISATKSAMRSRDRSFADQYKKWIKQGISPSNASRNVARSLSATMWGMWKNGSVYRSEWVGVSTMNDKAALIA